jgi:hypothetical protein
MRRNPKAGVLLALILLLTACTGDTSPAGTDPIPTLPPTAGETPLPPAATDPAPLQATPEPVAAFAPPDLPAQAGALLPEEAGLLDEFAGMPHYQLIFQVDYPNRSFQGSLNLEYTNQTHQPLDELYLHLLPNGGGSYGSGSLQVSDLSVEGESRAGSLLEGERLLQVPLPDQLAVGEKTSLRLEFQGQVPENFAGSGYGLYNYSDGVLVITGGYPLLAVFDEQGWHLNPPSNIGDSVFSRASLYDVQIQAASDLVVVATGTALEQQTEADNLIYRFVSGPVREFAMVFSPELQVESSAVGGTQINSYYLPGSQDAARTALEYGVQSLQVFNRAFGTYPYNELDMVEVPLRYAAGVEFPGLILLHRTAYLNGGAPHMEELVAHEVAHQWWYNVVGNNIFEDPWLDEALATYSSAHYFEEVRGAEAYAQQTGQYRQTYERLVRAGRDEPVASPLSYFEETGRSDRYGQVVYVKGALFLHLLRQEIGDQAFFAALQNYYQDMKFQIARPDDFTGAFEASHGASLDMFFEEWLYSSQ